MSKSINDIYKYLKEEEREEGENSLQKKGGGKKTKKRKGERESDAPSILEAYRKLVNY